MNLWQQEYQADQYTAQMRVNRSLMGMFPAENCVTVELQT